MKKSLVFVPFLLFANVLSNLKEKELQQESYFNSFVTKETKNSWINPVMVTFSLSEDNSLGVKANTKSFSISVNQPIFRSGAIFYSIKYANDLNALNKNNLLLKRRELIKEAYRLVIEYKKAILNRKNIMLNIKNAQIEVKKKKEDFLNGVGDSVLLNNAILKLNSLKLQLVDIENLIENLKIKFKNISDLDISKIVLPKFRLVSKKEYINNNIEYKSAILQKKIKKDLYKMQIGNSLFSVNLNASWNYQDVKYSTQTPLLQNNEKNFYKVGISITLPLSFNSINSINKSKIDYLKSNLELLDKKSVLNNDFKAKIKEIKNIDKKIAIYKKNIKIYEKLITSTQENIIAGNATKLDLEVIKNSKESMKLNVDILKLNKQEMLLELYYKVVTGSNKEI